MCIGSNATVEKSLLELEFKDLEMGVENYHVLELVGEGSFGQVYKGKRKLTGQIVAMKFILKHGQSKEDIQNLRQEIEILRKLKHENIIQMLDSFESPQQFCVVTELAQCDIFEILEDRKVLPEDEVQKIAKQLVRALHYLHSNRIIHRDMKPQNILICAGGVVKICDFGFARAMSNDTVALRSIKGTPLYMAPELVQEKTYNHTVDLWALGAILYELFVGQPPFVANSGYHELTHHIVNDPVKYTETMSAHFRSFLMGLLNKDPHSRLTWPGLLNHPFVAEPLAREPRANTSASRGCEVAWKGEQHLQTTGLIYASPEGCQLDKLENISRTVKGSKLIGQDNEALSVILLPLKNLQCRDQDVLTAKQSLNILSNLVAAGAINSVGVLDEICWEVIGFTVNLLRLKKTNYSGSLIKSFSVIKKLFENCGGGFGDSFIRHWVAMVELYKEASSSTQDASEMTGHLSLIVHIFGNSLLNPNNMRSLLGTSSPKEIKLNVLKMVSDVAFMDKDFYKHIHGANILELLKGFLTHEEPDIRAQACSAIGSMCRHNSYFYRLLAKHNIVSLLVDRCSDKDKHTRKFACFAIGNAAYHNDFLYEELRSCIPQLANLLTSEEENKTKVNASGALGNMVLNSNKLCHVMISKGGMQALLKLVEYCYVVAPNHAVSEIVVALCSLAKACAHASCRQFLRASDQYPIIEKLRHSSEEKVVKYASYILRITCKP
ncbi:hypothetical protein QVD17_39464 [Tagetes erecta]|uniref:non-specific serine/threonine protein kinase n=1 Tax=Tagetes erecta TaxID=13708 RepID=A0AAD8NG89_TARER|nr:hypothetical protein QVD17_39464 [Tagetes erecta]